MNDKKKRINWYKLLPVLLSGCMLTTVLAGCTGDRGTNRLPPSAQQSPSPSSINKAASERGQLQMLETGQTVIPFEMRNGVQYADVGRLADAIGFNKKWSDDGSFMIGDHDVVWSFTPDSRTAVKEEQSLSMEAKAIKQSGSLLIPVSMLKPLFDGEAVFSVEADQAAVFPHPGYTDPATAADAPAFGDDPLDPGMKPSSGGDAAAWFQQEAETVPAVANGAGLIALAKKFRGVPYDFGTGRFTVTRRFDCSSFVRYLYRNFFNISLPRTARAQSVRGVKVSRNKLRAGDLLFFYVPGRFKSNKKVGHVGIYMGGQRMIHSCPIPKDGVQISKIDNAYWRKTFLFAKRIKG